MSKPKKKLYERWWVWVLGLIVLMGIWGSVSNFIKNLGVKEIPNVMGLNYEDATTVLKSKGFKVTAIETDAESILSNSAWNRSVKIGEVFQINDEQYPGFFSNKTKDKTVIIYYAQNDYTYIKPEPIPEPDLSSEPDTSEPEVNEPDANESNPVELDTSTASDSKVPASSDGITPEFKETMDSYEAFFDEYIAFMDKFETSDNTLAMLTEFSDYMTSYADTMDKLDAIDESELSVADSIYYAEVSARISQKLLASAY